jgi:hypothetical protein
MSYIVNGFNGQIVAVIADGTVDTTSTDLQLVGRSVTDYGTVENENLVWLLQNFANNTAPPTPLVGQLWYNTSTKALYVWTPDNVWLQVASVTYVQDQKVSPQFTGTPTAPTASNGTNNTQIATTAFVQAQKVSPQFTGTPGAPTAPYGTSSTQIASTEFVQTAVNQLNLAGYAQIDSPEFIGIPTAPTAANVSSDTQIATTNFVKNSLQNLNLDNYATKASPAFTGTPTAPTASSATNNTQLATTAFVQAQKASPAFTGTPTAPTATLGTNNTQLATTAFVDDTVSNIDYSSLATLDSPAFTGVPTAPTAPNGTGDSQIATTAFVANAVAGGTFILSTASATVKGGVKVGSGLSINPSTAVLSANAAVSSVGFTAGAGISITGTNPITSSGTVAITNSGVTRLIAGSGVTLSGQTGEVTVSLSGGGGSSYALPMASAGTLGGIKVGSGLRIDSNGVLSSNTAAANIAYLDSTQTFSGVNTFSGRSSFNNLTSFTGNISANGPANFYSTVNNSGLTTFTGGAVSQQWNFTSSGWAIGYNTGDGGRVQLTLNGQTPVSFYQNYMKWSGSGDTCIQGDQTGSLGTAGISGNYTQGQAGLGIGVYGTGSSSAFGGDIFQANTNRSASSSFDFLQCYAENTSNSVYRLRGDGNAFADGSWTGGGADYAEYFESTDSTALPVGSTVVLVGDRVRRATLSDSPNDIIGIVRPKGDAISSAVVGNSGWNHWNQRYVTDDFGQYLLDTHTVYEWSEEIDGTTVYHSYPSHAIPAGIAVPQDAVAKTHDENSKPYTHRRENPAYDADATYTPREERNEWNIIGLLGQVPVLNTEPVNPAWRKMKSVSDTVDLYFIR